MLSRLRANITPTILLQFFVETDGKDGRPMEQKKIEQTRENIGFQPIRPGQKWMEKTLL